jgi:Spy/CpxP family protein refolding chaperone
MSRTLKWWIAVAGVVIFFAGAAVGLFAGAFHARRHHAFMFRHGPRMGERMQQHLRQELQLTPEQSAKVTPIIERMSAQLETIRQETSARVTQTMNESHQEMLPLLTPEQRQKLADLRRRHEHMMHRRDFRPPPDVPPPND